MFRRFFLGTVAACLLGGALGASYDIVGHRRAYADLIKMPMGAAPITPITPSCANSTTWFGRTSGSLTTWPHNYQVGYNTMICGLTTDGLWTLLDALYVMAAPDQPTALMNLVSSTLFAATKVGSPAWSGLGGYTGVAHSSGPATDYVDTGFHPVAPGAGVTQMQQDSAHYMVVIPSNIQAPNANSGGVIGLFNGTSGSYLLPWYSDGFTYFPLNNSTSGTGQGQLSTGHANGMWVSNRTATTAGNLTAYLDGVAQTPNATTDSSTSMLVSGTWIILAIGQPAAAPAQGTGNQVAAVSLGAGLTSTQISSLGSTPVTAANAAAATGLIPRICTYYITIGNSTCP